MTLSMWEQEKFDEGLSQGIDIGRDEGLNQGLSQGRSEGLSQGRSETLDAAAVFMQQNGIPVELISKFKNSLTEAWA